MIPILGDRYRRQMSLLLLVTLVSFAQLTILVSGKVSSTSPSSNKHKVTISTLTTKSNSIHLTSTTDHPKSSQNDTEQIERIDIGYLFEKAQRK